LNHTTTISTALNDFMNQEGLNLRKFAEKIDMNVGSLSYILNGNRTLSFDQLDQITSVMGLPKGSLYDQYYDEIIAGSPPNWRKIKPFLYGCAEVGNLDTFLKTVQHLLDNLVYSPHLFEVAEDFNNNGKKEAAIILYENVALSEKNQHSERLALCQYRLFMCKLENNQEKNYQRAIQFEMFVDRLDEYNQLEALKDLANIYRALHRWNKLEEIAERLKQKASFHYQNSSKYSIGYKPHRPLFTYIAYSNLLLGDVYDHRGEYEKSLQYVQLYEELDWVTDNDEETQQWKEKFQEWAKMNTLVIKLFLGDQGIISDYIASINTFESNEDEVLLSLLNILESANRYDYKIDDVLHHFKISSLIVRPKAPNRFYSRQIIEERLARINYELAHYFLKKEQYKDGFWHLIKGLEKSVSINEKNCIIKCVGLFESFREQSDSKTILAYKKFISEVYNNEKKIGSTPIG